EAEAEAVPPSTRPNSKVPSGTAGLSRNHCLTSCSSGSERSSAMAFSLPFAAQHPSTGRTCRELDIAGCLRQSDVLHRIERFQIITRQNRRGGRRFAPPAPQGCSTKEG